MCVASHPQHTHPPFPSPALLQLHCAVLLAKFAAAFCRDKLKSEAEEIGNLILFSCPATPQRPPTPSLNACHFCPFSAVSFSPRTVCAKNLIIETLSELESGTTQTKTNPKATKRRSRERVTEQRTQLCVALLLLSLSCYCCCKSFREHLHII